MNGQTVAVAIIVLAVFLFPIFLSHWVQSRADRFGAGEALVGQERFHVSRLVFAGVLSSNAVGALFVVILVVIPKKDAGSIAFFGGLAAIAFVGSWVTFARLRTTFVVVDAKKVEFVSGKKRLVIDRSAIRSVHTQSGMIVVDTGTVPRNVIPMIFARSHHLLAMLRS